MKKIAALCIIVVVFVAHGFCQEALSGFASNGFNYTRFTEVKKNVTPELESLTKAEFKSHPEYGVLPFNAPCKDCYELLEKRDETHRYFAKNGSKGKQFYQQTAYSPLSYYDMNGALRTIDSHLKPTGQAGIFEAKNQPYPVTINIPEKFTSILSEGKELQVNRNVSIYIQHADGSVTSLGEPDWSSYTAGDEGIVVHNFYPGIDLELRAGGGNIESFYHVNKPLNLTDGWLVIRDNMKVPQGLVYDFSKSEKSDNNFYEGSLYLNNKGGEHCFLIGAPYAYDENNQNNNKINLNYTVSDNGVYEMYLPVTWMNDAKRSYPLIIDPLAAVFQIQATPIAPNGLNSGYDPICFQNGCSYLMNAVVPNGGIVTNITTDYWYYAFNPCTLDSGAWDLTWGACRYPAAGKETCGIPNNGRCQRHIDVSVNFQSCLPPPGCNQTYPITLTMYRCVQPGGGCNNTSCLVADWISGQPWVITITGQMMDQLPPITTSAANASICEGSSVNLSVAASNGIPPYTYTWTDGTGWSAVGQTITVSPIVTTTYTVTVTTCGVGGDSETQTVTVTVFPNDNPDFTFSPNPACTGSPVAILGNPTNPAAPATSYDWLFTGGPPPINDQQNPSVTYNNTGNNLDITLHWTSPTSGCVFDKTHQITVNQGNPPSVTIAANPAGPICAGASVTFTATPSTVPPPGAGSTYQWYEGANPVGTGLLSYTTTGLPVGTSNVKIVLNDPTVICGTTAFNSNVIPMTVNQYVTPTATNIRANPSGMLCPGVPVSISVDTSGGGQAPTLEWFLTPPGPPAASTGSTTWTTNSNTFAAGGAVTFVLTSNAPCLNSPSATSTPLNMQVSPAVTTTTNGVASVCPGVPSVICAVGAAGDGGPYFYAWDNGVTTACQTVTPLSSTVYNVLVTDNCHSNPASGAVSITVLPAPTAAFTYTPSDISILTPTVRFTDQSANGGAVAWDFGDPTCPNNTDNTPNPVHTYCKPGTYTVKMIETNTGSGCQDSIMYALEIRNEYYYYIPNSFTPNGDGFNDYFAPQGTDAQQVLPLVYTMTIYNRWGEKIFETNNTSLPWAGEGSGGSKIAEAGVYVYRIKFQDSNYAAKDVVGSVTLLR